MNWRLLSAVVLLGLMIRTAGGADDGAPPKVAQMKLAPSSAAPAESLVAALCDNSWSRTGPINILGAGSTQTLHFSRNKEGLKVSTVLHAFKNFEEQKKPAAADLGKTAACEVHGPVLFKGAGRNHSWSPLASNW